MLCNVNAQCVVNIAMYGNGNKNVITEKKKFSGAFCSLKLKLRERMVIMFIDGMFLGTI